MWLVHKTLRSKPMCLAIPGKVVEIGAESQPKMGKVSFGGILRQVCLDWVPDVKVGEYVIVHVGFAISKMDEKEATETLQLFDEIEASLDEPRLPEPE
jgi:hydrogenase expression/formation protein HypC